jgi:hypothetical protein
MIRRLSLEKRLSFCALAVALAAGCSAEPPAPELDSEASQLTPAEQEALVARIAFDPNFVAFSELVLQVQNGAGSKFRAMTPAERAAASAEAQDIAADARQSGASVNQLTARVEALTGIPATDLRTLQVLAGEVREAFPQLAQTGPALVGQAVQANPLLTGLIIVSGDVDDDDEEEDTADCLNDCVDEYIAAHNAAIWDYLLDLVQCGSSGNPFAIAICMLVATAECAFEQLVATNNLDNCEDDCLGIPPQGTCDSDSDCLASEWCDTGTLGIGDNECEPDKFIGEVCSRDAKCLSGCCKYDFWQNPVSMTCNPAADCN